MTFKDWIRAIVLSSVFMLSMYFFHFAFKKFFKKKKKHIRHASFFLVNCEMLHLVRISYMNVDELNYLMENETLFHSEASNLLTLLT